MSTSRSSTDNVNWPSCGRRRSTMFMFAMILRRLMSAGPMFAGSDERVVECAVDAVADSDLVVLRLEVHVGGTLAQRLRHDRVDDLDDRGDRRARVDDPEVGRVEADRPRPRTPRRVGRRARWRGRQCRAPVRTWLAGAIWNLTGPPSASATASCASSVGSASATSTPSSSALSGTACTARAMRSGSSAVVELSSCACPRSASGMPNCSARALASAASLMSPRSRSSCPKRRPLAAWSAKACARVDASTALSRTRISTEAGLFDVWFCR